MNKYNDLMLRNQFLRKEIKNYEKYTKKLEGDVEKYKEANSEFIRVIHRLQPDVHEKKKLLERLVGKICVWIEEGILPLSEFPTNMIEKHKLVVKDYEFDKRELTNNGYIKKVGVC